MFYVYSQNSMHSGDRVDGAPRSGPKEHHKSHLCLLVRNKVHRVFLMTSTKTFLNEIKKLLIPITVIKYCFKFERQIVSSVERNMYTSQVFTSLIRVPQKKNLCNDKTSYERNSAVSRIFNW